MRPTMTTCEPALCTSILCTFRIMLPHLQALASAPPVFVQLSARVGCPSRRDRERVLSVAVQLYVCNGSVESSLSLVPALHSHREFPPKLLYVRQVNCTEPVQNHSCSDGRRAYSSSPRGREHEARALSKGRRAPNAIIRLARRATEARRRGRSQLKRRHAFRRSRSLFWPLLPSTACPAAHTGALL